MSIKLLEYAKLFADGQIDTDIFVDEYQRKWKWERDNIPGDKDSRDLSLCLSTIFCLADLYNPDDDKEPYELNSEELISKIRVEVNKV